MLGKLRNIIHGSEFHYMTNGQWPSGRIAAESSLPEFFSLLCQHYLPSSRSVRRPPPVTDSGLALPACPLCAAAGGSHRQVHKKQRRCRRCHRSKQDCCEQIFGTNAIANRFTIAVPYDLPGDNLSTRVAQLCGTHRNVTNEATTESYEITPTNDKYPTSLRTRIRSQELRATDFHKTSADTCDSTAMQRKTLHILTKTIQLSARVSNSTIRHAE